MLYEYECNNCKNTVVKNKPMAERDSEEKCEKCEESMKRVFSSPGIGTGDGFKQ